jgi:hypothetical protein
MSSTPKPRLFEPSTTRRVQDGRGVVYRRVGDHVADSNIDSTSSFRYDPPGTGLKSTQQIGIDFSKFENHTFFNSAVVNVNVAFDRIIQEYPFDGSKADVEQFFDSLTGFEKYVYDSFPKNNGYLFFSGSTGSGGTYIRVADSAGSGVPALAKTKTGISVIDPGLKSFSIEAHVLPASGTNDSQVIVQKVTGSNFGFTLALSQSSSPNSCSIVFMVSSGSQQISAAADIVKGQFSHICAVMNRKGGINRAQLFINESLAATSTGYAEIADFGFSGAPLLIGSGVSQRISNATPTTFIPYQTFSGALDELRFFHGVRTLDLQKSHGRKTIYAAPDLRLHFKFNEPTGSIGSDSLVIDSSGFSLHSSITGYSSGLRSTGSFAVPMSYERISECPVIFPNFSNVSTLNVLLLNSASKYDSENPNLITRMVPDHYFNMGAHTQGFDSDEGDIGDPYVGGGIPGSGRLGSTQLLSAFLYVYAKHFDELKVMLDAFSNVISVDYDPETSTPDQFLALAAKFRGFELPNVFNDASIEQHVFGDNLTSDVGLAESSLSSVQNQIWRRILTNLGEIIRSKGTLYSVKAMIRAVGINPDSTMRIREYGGPTTYQLTHARETRTEVASMLDFSGSMATNAGTENAQGFLSTKPVVTSSYLSGTRREIGYPAVSGTMVNAGFDNLHGISNLPCDGMFTSGSWTYEAIYRFPSLLTGSHASTQSLVRLHTTGTTVGHNVLANVVLFSSESAGNEFDKLCLYVRASTTSSEPYLSMYLTGVNVFDGNQWNISFGRNRADAVNTLGSSSYFLRAARQNHGTIHELYTKAGFFKEAASVGDNAWQTISTANASGAFIVIGSQSLVNSGTTFLGGTDVTDTDARATNFTGRLAQVRFWSKGLRVDEWSEHVRNFKSVGVKDPTTNFNFVYKPPGSFERLRTDISIDQYTTSSSATGRLILQDFSQNILDADASGFEASREIIKPETFYYSFLSPKFDEASTTEKVRARGYSNPMIDHAFSGSIAPVYEIDKSELPTDDPRFTIDISSVAALDEDIINIFATLSLLDNVLGAPELQFSPDYPGLDHLRLIYFNRLTSKVNLKSFFEFFRWFDSSMGIFIERLLPRKTKFMGINYVIESHMLERPKFEHYTSEAYLGESNRSSSRPAIYLQQIVGTVTRY